jgi:RND family efflux transporter MFP subunit
LKLLEATLKKDQARMPSRRLLAGIAVALVIGGGALAAGGIVARSQAQAAVQTWTNDQATPNVTLAKLSAGASVQALTLPGTIQPFYKAPIYARANGYVKSWSKDIGAHVSAGEVLATIEAPDLDQQLAQAQASLASTKANSDIAAITAQRNDTLVVRQVVAQQLADQTRADAAAKRAVMDASQANVRQLEAMQQFKQVVAPFDGIVTARNTDIGALISSGSAGQALFEVSDLHRVRIFVRVPQAYSAQVHPGLKAKFGMPQFPGQSFDAVVTSTSGALDAASRSLLVELQADNSDGKLLAGAYSQVTFELPGDPKTMRIPATALVISNRGSQVALFGPLGKVTLQNVQLGRDFGDNVEVVAGLSPGDQIIDAPPETLQAGDVVRLVGVQGDSQDATPRQAADALSHSDAQPSAAAK